MEGDMTDAVTKEIKRIRKVQKANLNEDDIIKAINTWSTSGLR